MEIEKMFRIMAFNFGSLFYIGLMMAYEGKTLIVLVGAIFYGLHFIWELSKFEQFKHNLLMEVLPDILKNQNKKSKS
jgi:hypothetical protein